MYSAFLERTRKSIDSLRKHIATSEAVRSVVYDKAIACKAASPCFSPLLLSVETAPDRLEWRIIDHCAAVTRIYAIYEQFEQEMVREHLALLQKNLEFSKLPVALRSSYRRGLSTILEKIDGPRYGHLDLADLIKQYGSALADKEYSLEPLAMLIQEQNLRLQELSRLLAASGITDVIPWINEHHAVTEFFGKGGRISASAEHEMATLVEYRNDAAHGSVNIADLPGLDYLHEFCDFISVVCEAISEKVQATGLECLVGNALASERGKVDTCIKDGRVLIASIAGKLGVGDTIYLCGDDYCIERKIIGIQLDNVSLDEVDSVEPLELGIELDNRGRKRARIFSIGILAREGIVSSPAISHEAGWSPLLGDGSSDDVPSGEASFPPVVDRALQ